MSSLPNQTQEPNIMDSLRARYHNTLPSRASRHRRPDETDTDHELDEFDKQDDPPVPNARPLDQSQQPAQPQQAARPQPNDAALETPSIQRDIDWYMNISRFLERKWVFYLILLLLAGASIAGGTYGLFKDIQHCKQTALLDSPRGLNLLRNKANTTYNDCYYGCEDCKDLDFAWNACLETARVKVGNMTCDGKQMWFRKDRYPEDCLMALGETFRETALPEYKDLCNTRWSWVIFAPFFALFVFVGLNRLWIFSYQYANKRIIRLQSQQQEDDTPDADARTLVQPTHGINDFWWLCCIVACLLPTGMAEPVKIHPCWGHHKAVDQYFKNHNGTIGGRIHGWTSGCYSRPYDCKDNCTGIPTSSGKEDVICPPCHEDVEINTPMEYVENVTQSVRDCGFELTTKGKLVDGETIFESERIGNPELESKKWVSIYVNQYNITDVVDPSVLCLAAIGGPTTEPGNQTMYNN